MIKVTAATVIRATAAKFLLVSTGPALYKGRAVTLEYNYDHAR
jgi:hypothetical protein